jgi:hypothetical protein
MEDEETLYPYIMAAEELLKGVTTLEEYNEAVKWASENWSEEDIQAFNKVLQSGDESAIRLAVKGLITDYKGGAGGKTDGINQINLHGGTKPANDTIVGYKSEAEMIKDMSDPRYNTDPAYRKKVQAKIAKTDMSKWYE